LRDGVLSATRRLFLGAPTPKARRVGDSSTPTTASWYEGMHWGYRWFRKDELVRRSVLANAYYSTLSSGFDTALEGEGPIEDYAYVKERVDALNARVNMDQILFTAQVKRSIYGRAGFEVVPGADGYPERLIPLRGDQLKPDVGADWALTGFTYQGRRGFYAPGEVLYFTNTQLEADWEGLSDVEPVLALCEARDDVLREDFREMARSRGAPYVILKADTSGLAQAEADRVVEELAEAARAGRSIAINESVEAEVVNLTPDIEGLCRLLDRLEQGIAANFGVPGFLLGRPVENRATAYAEFEAYIGGVVAQNQRYLKRELERQWYAPLVARILADEGEDWEGEPPVRVKHRWRTIRATDVYEMAQAVAALWGDGPGPLAGDAEAALGLLGLEAKT
jgi:hypothetical protein